MAKIYKKQCYKPLPPGAIIIEGNDSNQYAYWIEGNEEYTTFYVETKNKPRIIEESEYFIARFTDATGRYRERSTGCRDRRVAEHKLNTWVQEIEKIKAGILTQEEFAVSKRVNDAIEDQLEHYEQHFRAKGAMDRHVSSVLSRIHKVCGGCSFKRMIDMNSTTFSCWLNKHTNGGMDIWTRNSYREVMVSFSNWALTNNSLTINPFGRVPKARESSGSCHDDPEGQALMEQISRPICIGKPLLMDKVYEENSCRNKAKRCGIRPVVLPKRLTSDATRSTLLPAFKRLPSRFYSLQQMR